MFCSKIHDSVVDWCQLYPSHVSAKLFPVCSTVSSKVEHRQQLTEVRNREAHFKSLCLLFLHLNCELS